jgi:hypothetical protein
MMHDYTRYVAPKPTLFKGVRFRSRLEARWAAMFDLLGLKWDYEPIDLAGWTPDFRITVEVPVWMDVDDELDETPPQKIGTATVNVFAEVKPVYEDHFHGHSIFAKALAKQRDIWVLLLGGAPQHATIGELCDPPELRTAGTKWGDVHEALNGVIGGKWDQCPDHESLWRQAGSAVQWQGRIA